MEAIFTADMLQAGYLAPCLHAKPLDPELESYPPVVESTQASPRIALSNSFGFGGTNVSLVLSKS
jgi:3-oxoacyl-[acyl-carrier-protein] synthase-1